MTIFNALQGSSIGLSMAKLKSQDRATAIGHNFMLNAVIRANGASILFRQFDKLQEISGKNILPLPLRVTLYTGILATGFVKTIAEHVTLFPASKFSNSVTKLLKWERKDDEITPPRYVKIASFFQLHGGTILQVASLTTNVALFIFGSQLYAGAGLTCLAIGYLNEKNLLPERCRRIYLSLSPCVNIVGTFLSPGVISKIFGVFEIIAVCSELSAKQRTKPILFSDSKSVSHLSLENFERILKEERLVEVKREHVRIKAFPHYPKADLNEFLKWIDDFSLAEEDIFSLLNEKLRGDPRWVDSEANKKLEGLDEIGQKAVKIKYCKDNLKTLIEQISFSRLSTGENLGFAEYAVLQNYVNCIAKDLPNIEDKKTQSEILVQLAVEGGDYCSSGIYYQMEAAASRALYGKDLNGFSLKQKILMTLQQERQNICSGLVLSRIPKLAFVALGGEEDVHAHNQLVAAIGEDFGLPDRGLDAESSLYTGSALGRAVSNLLLKYNPDVRLDSEDLWKKTRSPNGDYFEGYTPDRVVNTISELVGTTLFPKPDFSNYLYNTWLPKQNLEESKKEEIEALLAAGTIPIQKLVFAVLADMGILAIQSPVILGAKADAK